MGACQSAEVKQQAYKTKEIDKELEHENELQEAIIKLLLLGTGASGKSTILKQIRILHDNGFSEAEIEQRKAVVYANIIDGMVSMIEAMHHLAIPLTDPNNERNVVSVLQVVKLGDAGEPFTPEVLHALKGLWKDNGIQEVYARRNEYVLEDCVKYFMDSLDRIAVTDYKPLEQDILYTRIPTQGIVECRFHMKDLDFRVFDVGGQRSQRRKWIHCFDNVNAVIFVTSMSEYDQQLAEDSSTNRMVESMRLFGNICNNKWFIKTSMIIFLNKKDLFEEKIERFPMSEAFPEYKGPHDSESSAKHMEDQFLSLNRNEQRTVYAHKTCAVDKNQVQLVIENTLDMIIQQNLSDTGMV